jgi:hypothetical protein
MTEHVYFKNTFFYSFLLLIYLNINYFYLGSEVVFQCRDEGPLRAKIRWIRNNNQPLPPGSHVSNGRLEIPNIQLEHSGSYVCEAEKYLHLPGSQMTVQLTVEKCNLYLITL